MTRRRLAAVAALVVVVAGLLGGIGRAPRSVALAALDPGHEAALPYALVNPLWGQRTIATGARAWTPLGRDRARAALRIIGSEQRAGVLTAVLGTRPARVVALGELQDRGHTVGATALLALPVARHNVRATVPGNVRFTTPVLRDVLVDVDLRRAAIVAVAPGPASQTSTWTAKPATAPPASAVAAAHSMPAFVGLSAQGPRFTAYDGTRALGPAGRDWPVSLIFAGHATVAKVKQALRAVGFTHRGEARLLAYGAPGGAVRFDADRGVKTVQDANGTDVHVRLYAPPATDHFTDPRFGSVVVATVHLDRGEAPATGPRLFGFSEAAEGRVGDALAHGLGWHVERDRVALGNAEPFRHDLAAPDHVWWSNGRATLISVP
jgi:hypothetical protein